MATAKGRRNQERQKTQSTQPKLSYQNNLKTVKLNIERLKKILPEGKYFSDALNEDILTNNFPISDIPNKKTTFRIVQFL